MTQDEVIQLAKQALLPYYVDSGEPCNLMALERFALLVEDKVRQEIAEKNAPVIKKVNEHIKELQDAVKAEREACAKLCDSVNSYDNPMTANDVADAIRARGKQ